LPLRKQPTLDTPLTGHHDTKGRDNPLSALEGDLREGLQLFWQTAGRIQADGGVRLADPANAYFALEGNFFSALFLYSYVRAGIPAHRRILYAAVNQCLRGMVTGCDNLLDNEYKMTLDTDLPAAGRKFRSILDIMVSDRVLFEILLDYCRSSGAATDLARQAGTASLNALTRSGAQEASEEAGISKRLPPGEVLSQVHHFKTGVLFQCPWAIPSIIEGNRELANGPLSRTLYLIGMGCQIMDDMVDLMEDVRNRRHNYVASLIEHSTDTRPGLQLKEFSTEMLAAFYDEFPEVGRTAYATALEYLESGLSGLFTDADRFMVPQAVAFIAHRIGVDRIPAASGG
jgi:hypothetical protein